MYFVPFEAEHYLQLEAQDAQQWVTKYVVADTLKLLENEFSLTLMLDGQPIVCFGVVPFWEGRAHLCAMIDKRVDASIFLGVHQHAVAFRDGLPFRRLEAAVDVDFAAAHRWMKLLGFECEAPLMRGYDVDGRDCALYARVRK